MKNTDKKAKELHASLVCAHKLSDGSEEKIRQFIKDRYEDGYILDITVDPSLGSGFTLTVGCDYYDWSQSGRLYQLGEDLSKAVSAQEPLSRVIPMIKESVSSFSLSSESHEIGRIISVGDGVARLEGLGNVSYSEIIEFENGVRGMVLDLKRGSTGCIIFGDDRTLSEGMKAYRTFRTAGIPVGDGLLGRVVGPLGDPLDGNGPVVTDEYYPVEAPAPAITDRKPVNRPLYTGLLTIDAMFPVGRGQRELIIGDRQTGKTAIAVDAIINQKGKDVICIYVATGQKESSVARVYETLRTHGALPYTVIVNASAGMPDPYQYISPYSGCAIGEYCMNSGCDVLIVYDDLSKHAISYRTISLLLERSPGREAYPGDVFYLHSRLLERSAQLSDKKGGGSITALPIVETQAGDVSAYIPTNIISITDGQIYLEPDLFFAGQRPAVNIGLSVSRVGSSAQTKAVKKAAGTLRLDLAQYKEMEVFNQFASDLDDATKSALSHGQRLMALLRQDQYAPYDQADEVILLVCANAGIFDSIPLDLVDDARDAILSSMRNEHGDIISAVENTGILGDDMKEVIISSAGTVCAGFTTENDG